MKHVIEDMTDSFIIFYEAKDGFLKFAIGSEVPSAEDMRRLICVVDEIFQKFQHQQKGDEILNRL